MFNDHPILYILWWAAVGVGLVALLLYLINKNIMIIEKNG
jgi:hypothetical protein